MLSKENNTPTPIEPKEPLAKQNTSQLENSISTGLNLSLRKTDSDENNNSPLYDIALSYLKEEYSGNSSSFEKSDLTKGMEVIDQLIKGSIKVDEALQLAATAQPYSFIVSTQRIVDILKVGNRPIQKSRARQTPVNGRLQARNWSKNEDNRLLAAVHKFGLNNWVKVSSFVGNNRSQSQCSQRWNRGLDPTIDRSQWSKEEDEKLLDLVKTYGDKAWKTIAENMKSRSDVQCRYHYKHMKIPDNVQHIISNKNKPSNITINSKNEVDHHSTDNQHRLLEKINEEIPFPTVSLSGKDVDDLGFEMISSENDINEKVIDNDQIISNSCVIYPRDEHMMMLDDMFASFKDLDTLNIISIKNSNNYNMNFQVSEPKVNDLNELFSSSIDLLQWDD